MIAESTLRELGAISRTFTSVKWAMIWYRQQAARRLWRCTVLEIGTVPYSEEKKSEDGATYAKITACLRNPHPTDPEDQDEAAEVRWHMSDDRLAWLVSWYEGDGWGDGTWLANKAGMNRWAFTRRCKKTERILRNRMEDAGLLEEE